MTATFDFTPDPKPTQPPYIQCDQVDGWKLWHWMEVCPFSQTMVAFDRTNNESLLYALPCNRWSCRHCARRRTRSLACRTERARPNRLVTLTVDPKLYTCPREAFDRTRRQVPEWVKLMRNQFGPVEYLRVTELTKAGWPHYHMLVRSAYIPHVVAKTAWCELTGAIIVDIRQVKKQFNTYFYLLKYLSKMHHIKWTARHLSYSRDFFRDEEQSDYAPHELEERTIHHMHPAHFVVDRHKVSTVHRVTPRSFRVETP